ncbi:MAG: transcriptional regulator, partial [Sphingobacteriaceae bacterium]
YKILKIAFPENSYYPKEILNGFKRFCQDYAFSYTIVRDLKQECVQSGEVFITLMEDDLVQLLEKTLEAGLVVGKDVGVISYNETPLKRIILNGITTVSTDFEMMGRKAAELILSTSFDHVAIPFSLRLRNSL